MSRRASPPPSDSAYLRSLPSSFLVAPAPTTDDHHTSAGGRPSDLYSRPAPPSDVASDNFHWGDDSASTIAPDDSVSQIDRRFTGKRRLLGPRAMDAVPEVPSVPEEYALEETVHQDYVPPELLEDDRSTVVPSGQGVRAINPSTSVGPLARARGEGSGSGSGGTTPVPYSSPRQYARDEEEDGDERLLAMAAGGAAGAYSNGSGKSGPGGTTVAPYSSRPTNGYAAVGHEEEYDDGGVYAAYSRARDQDLESRAGFRDGGGAGFGGGSGHGQDASADTNRSGATGTTLVGALSNPMGLFKSLSGRGSGKEESSFYTPHELAFQPPSSSSLDRDGKQGYPPTWQPNDLQKVPSLDVAGPHDRSYNGYAGAGGDGSQIQPKPLWQRWFWDTTPMERRAWEHKQGQGMQRWPFASWTLALIMTIVMIVELVKMNSYTGSPIQTKPSFNVMIGPSGAVMINLGARFAGCMKYISNVTDIDWTCLKDTNKATLSSSDGTCTMSDICGFGGFEITDGAGGPDQSFRFFVPMFLHAGVVHLLFNMLAQCFSSALVERMMGTPRFLVLYLAAGIFGFILGANFALVGQPSVGASGAIFGTHAALLVDLLAHWKIEYRPKRKLVYLIIEIIIGLGLGWVPGIDNFAHLGGFLVGLLTATVLFPIIHPTRRHKLIFVALRLIALPLLIVVFVVLTRNFYTSDPSSACSWCRYLSCWPTSSNNHCKGTGLSTYSTSSLHLPEVFSLLFSTFILPLL
ncbi:hypothetical protein JCM8547_002218 [Rhodosporidiobolus lusitaniae]